MTELGKAHYLLSRALGRAGIVGPLVLGLGFALILAYQALDAAREHRAAAQATVCATTPNSPPICWQAG